jgi:SAM-dependent methyltransferase
MRNDVSSYVEDISEFLGMSPADVEERLLKGFHWNHAEVAADFRRVDPKTDDELLDFYMQTTAYIFELACYHMDPAWNYQGGMEGYVNRLKAEGKKDVLVLGDGIGDLTMELHHAGFNVRYHDLKGSLNAEFAQYRFWKAFGNQPPPCFWTNGWQCDLGASKWDAVIALDFMEHLPEPQVALWTRAVARGLRKDGLFAAQNAFACGDDEHGGSIPMHISASNHYEHDWWPLLHSLNFVQCGDVWARLES